MLEDHLDYHETPEDSAFVSEVMARVRHQQRIRRMVLWGTGVVGALFGTAGALILSNSLVQALDGFNLMHVSVSTIALVAFAAWLFHDETAATG